MFTRLRIENFKALTDIEIALSPITVLIGENSCGKTSVLEALDLLGAIATRDVDEYFDDRDWTFEEIRSQFGSGGRIVFELEYRCTDGTRLCWRLSIGHDSKSGWVVDETIIDVDAGTTLMFNGAVVDSNGSSHSRGVRFFDPASGDNGTYLGILRASGLKSFNERSGPLPKGVDPRLAELKRALSNTSSLDLLSPESMRSHGNGSRPAPSIGRSGRHLAAFIDGLGDKRRREIGRILSHLLGYPVSIETSQGPAWIDLFLRESWPEAPTSTIIDRRLMSDGLLRMLALVALCVGDLPNSGHDEPAGRSGLILIDEIEDGLNAGVAGEVLGLFKELCAKTRHQVVLTTHSPVMVNFVDERGIVFLWRDTTGAIRSAPLFSSPELARKLELLNPGEIWLNYSKDYLVDQLGRAQGEGHGDD